MVPKNAAARSAAAIKPSDVARWTLYGALTLWGGLITLTQMNRASRLRGKASSLSITLPTYRFFGPIPATFDRHLLFREKFADGSLGPWAELDFGAHDPRRLHHMLLGPNRRRQKVVHDADTLLLKTHRHSTVGMGRVVTSEPYRALLRLVSDCVPHPPETREIQFALGRAAKWDPSVQCKIIFASEFHPLQPETTSQL